MNDKEIRKILKEIFMLLSIYIKKGSSQSVLIQELSAVGFKPKRIAEILNTTPNTVRVILSQQKKKRKAKK